MNSSENLKKDQKLGFAGKLAKSFLHSKLTPVIAVSSILLGLVAVVLTPKEEEPQISVPMIDVSIGAPGFEASEIERKVTEPARTLGPGRSRICLFSLKSTWRIDYSSIQSG